jgi:hypothetical protein
MAARGILGVLSRIVFGSSGSCIMPEHRRSKRIPARLKVWCEGDDFTLLAETENVSLHGLFVRSASTPPVRGAFRLNIGDLGTVADVEVCWLRNSSEPGRAGMGLRIVGFQHGEHEYRQFVENVRTPSGEFRFGRQSSSEGDDSGDDEP